MAAPLSLPKAVWRIVLVMGLILPASVFGHDIPESGTQVWRVGQRQWTVQEEDRYAQWVEANISEDFFIRHDIPVDCADVPYAVRWIYARIFHLPAAATTVDNQLIGHWSMNWGHLPTHAKWYKDRRFRAALRSMLSKTSTKTLPSDIYPIHVAHDTVKAGTVVLIAESHAGIVRNCVMDGSTVHPVQTLEANSPCRIQQLIHKDFVSTDPGPRCRSGLAKFRWPIMKDSRWQYLSTKDHPFYAEEQGSAAFSEGYVNYLDAVARRIDPTVYDPQDKINRMLDTLTRRLQERIAIVLAGSIQCRGNRCPEGSRLWNIHSTPGRDDLILVNILYLEELIKKNLIDRDAVLNEMEKICLQISPRHSITLRYIFQNAAWMSSDPEAAITARWGLDKCGMIAMHLRHAQEAIAYIHKTYDKTDPQFAERSIWVQMKIVNDMREEARKSLCKTTDDSAK